MAKKTKKSLQERLREKKAALASRGGGNSFILRQKEEGTIRFRILPTGEDNDFVGEITSFWLGSAGEVLSPATIGKPCPVMEKYNELKSSDDDDDKELAKKLVPRNKSVTAIVMYKDSKGTEIDTENSGKLLQITNGIHQEIIDLYLDEDEWGDMTDPKEGYDLKQTRTGKGQKDTNYTISACKNTALKTPFNKTVIDLDELIGSYLDTYDTALGKLEKFLGGSDDEDDEDEKPKKSKRKTDFEDDEDEKPKKSKRREVSDSKTKRRRK